MSSSSITTWIAVGALAGAALMLAAVGALALRVRRRDDGSDELASAREEARRAWDETKRVRADAARARSELRWVRRLAAAGGSGSLDDVLRRALEAAAGLASASAALIVLPREGDEPLVASAGLSAEERSRELLGLPPGGGEARAVSLTYRYADDERDQDEFRLTGGIALPAVDPDGVRVGTVAVFWRRAEHEVTEDELGRLEGLAAALGPALSAALRLERLRLELDVDAVSGLGGRTTMLRALGRECERARRYGHPLSLLLLQLDPPPADDALRGAAQRLRTVLRTPDVVCHLGRGRLAALLPESTRADAEHLARRLERMLATRIEAGARANVPTATAELRHEDDAVSLLARAEEDVAAAASARGLGEMPQSAVEPGR